MRFPPRIRLSAHEHYVASVLMLAMLLVQLLVVVPLLVAHVRSPWITVGAHLAASLGIGLLAGGLLRRAAKFRHAVTSGAYAQAFLALALLRTAMGAWLLATGRSWGRYSHLRLPRADSVYDFVFAAVLGVLAATCALAYHRTRARSGHGTRVTA